MATTSENLSKLLVIIQELEAQLGDVPVALEAEREAGRRERDQEVFDLIAMKDTEKVEFGASEYARGYTEGQAAVVVPPTDKIYSQIELDQAVMTATAPLNDLVLALQAQVAELQLVVDALPAKVEEAVAKAVGEFKAMALEKLKALEADFT